MRGRISIRHDHVDRDLIPIAEMEGLAEEVTGDDLHDVHMPREIGNEDRDIRGSSIMVECGEERRRPTEGDPFSDESSHPNRFGGGGRIPG